MTTATESDSESEQLLEPENLEQEALESEELPSESESEPIPAAESSSSEELSAEEEQAVYDKQALRQAKQDLAMKKASDKINDMLDSGQEEIERTDIDDLLSPTTDSPADEMERTDTEDVTGLSDKDNDEIFGTAGIDDDEGDSEGDDGDGSREDDDLSDLFEVTNDDVMYGGERRKPKPKRIKRSTKQWTSSASGGLSGMQY
jgi:hypothetical protein